VSSSKAALRSSGTLSRSPSKSGYITISTNLISPSPVPLLNLTGNISRITSINNALFHIGEEYGISTQTSDICQIAGGVDFIVDKAGGLFSCQS
jgi:hypothetical protein